MGTSKGTKRGYRTLSKLRVFISYSRGDKVFAGRLVAALEARGLAVTIDERDLPTLEDWRRELLAFLQQADAVVFVVSSRSVTSKICAWELQQVAQLNKRLAPVVIESIPDDRIPQEIAKINYLYFDLPDQFELQADRLAAALQLDLNWVKEHTRLGELARRWDERESASSLTLRGQELLDAERWIASHPRGAPEATNLHRQLIEQSRAYATRRQRLTLVGSAAVAAISLALAGTAYWQRGIAKVNEERARIERDRALIAQSRFMADVARQRLSDGDAVTALALAIEGLPKKARAPDRPWTPEAEQIASRAINESREENVQDLGVLDIRRAMFSPTGKLGALVSWSRRAHVWDLYNNTKILDLAAAAGDRQLVGFSTNLRYFAHLVDGQIVRIYDLLYAPKSKSWRLPDFVSHIAFHPRNDNLILYSINSTGPQHLGYGGGLRGPPSPVSRLLSLDLNTGRHSVIWDDPSVLIERFAASPSGDAFALMTSKIVRLVDSHGKISKLLLETTRRLRDVAFCDDRTLLVTSYDEVVAKTYVSEVRLDEDKTQTTDIILNHSIAEAMCYISSERRLLASHSRHVPEIILYDLDTQKELGRISQLRDEPDHFIRAAFQHTFTVPRIVSIGARGLMRSWSLYRTDRAERFVSVSGVEGHADTAGRFVVQRHGKANVLYDTQSDMVVPLPEPLAQESTITTEFANDGSKLIGVTGTDPKQVILFDTRTHTVSALTTSHGVRAQPFFAESHPRLLEVARDGLLRIMALDRGVSVLTLPPTASLPTTKAGRESFLLVDAFRRIAVLGVDGGLQTYSTITGELLLTSFSPSNFVEILRQRNSDTSIYVGTPTGSIILVDVKTGLQVHVESEGGHHGATVVDGGESERFILLRDTGFEVFDRTNGRKLCGSETQAELATDALFAPNGGMVIISHYDSGWVRAWALPGCSLKWKQPIYRPMQIHMHPIRTRVFVAADGAISAMFDINNGNRVAEFNTNGRATIGRITKDGKYFGARAVST